MVACLPFTNVSGKSGWKVNGTCLFWVVPAGNFREQRNIWKASPVFPEGIFQSEFRVPFLPSHQFHTSFSPSQSFSGKSNWLNLYKWLTRFRGETYQSWIFAYHLLNRGPTGLPMQMVNNSNQCECVPLARAPLLFARQNVFLFNKGERNLLYNRTK